jgi:short chain dehydrogenase
MRDAQVKGKIVLVSSLVGFCGLIGYSQYAPMKHAIRGLAETLRSELILHDISVHCYFPATILTPGFETEQKTKPEPLMKIEEADAPLKPEVCAKKLVQGVSNGNFFITSDLQTDLFRAACSGVQPGNGWLLDRLKGLIGTVSLRPLIFFARFMLLTVDPFRDRSPYRYGENLGWIRWYASTRKPQARPLHDEKYTTARNTQMMKDDECGYLASEFGFNESDAPFCSTATCQHLEQMSRKRLAPTWCSPSAAAPLIQGLRHSPSATSSSSVS